MTDYYNMTTSTFFSRASTERNKNAEFHTLKCDNIRQICIYKAKHHMYILYYVNFQIFALNIAVDVMRIFTIVELK